MIDTYVFSGIEDAARVRSIAALDDCSDNDYVRDCDAARQRAGDMDLSVLDPTDLPDPAELAAGQLSCDRDAVYTACEVWRELRACEIALERLS